MEDFLIFNALYNMIRHIVVCASPGVETEVLSEPQIFNFGHRLGSSRESVDLFDVFLFYAWFDDQNWN